MPAPIPTTLDDIYQLLGKGDIHALARFMTNPDACRAVRVDVETEYALTVEQAWLDAIACLIRPKQSPSQQAKRLRMAQMMRAMLINLKDEDVSEIMCEVLIKEFDPTHKDEDDPFLVIPPKDIIFWFQSANLLNEQDATKLWEALELRARAKA